VAFARDSLKFDLSGTTGELQFGTMHIKWRVVSVAMGRRQLKKSVGVEYFDAGKIGPGVCLRHWRPGDRFQPIGMPKAVKLQNLFTNSRVPRHRRHEAVIATGSNGEIFWVENVRISERFKLTEATSRCLEWRWRPAQ
jgi:tRNA(Ile)-lysidine synthase